MLPGSARYQPNRLAPLYLPSRLLQKKDNGISQLAQLSRHSPPLARRSTSPARLPLAVTFSSVGRLTADTTPARHDHLRHGVASPRKTTPADRRCTFPPLRAPLAGGAIAHHGAMQLPAHCWISLSSAPPASLPGFAESACCKSMFQVFQMFQRYVAGVVYRCYKGRLEYCTVVMAIYVCF